MRCSGRRAIGKVPSRTFLRVLIRHLRCVRGQAEAVLDLHPQDDCGASLSCETLDEGKQDEGQDEADDRESEPGDSAKDSEPSGRELGFGSALIQWLGKFHPPSINFPIALLLMAAVAEALLLATGRPLFDHAARFCVWFGSAGMVYGLEHYSWPG